MTRPVCVLVDLHLVTRLVCGLVGLQHLVTRPVCGLVGLQHLVARPVCGLADLHLAARPVCGLVGLQHLAARPVCELVVQMRLLFVLDLQHWTFAVPERMQGASLGVVGKEPHVVVPLSASQQQPQA